MSERKSDEGRRVGENMSSQSGNDDRGVGRVGINKSNRESNIEGTTNYTIENRGSRKLCFCHIYYLRMHSYTSSVFC